ncbi:MAG TPA: MipA/OmpV family protein [Sphingomicrobium sp.]|nr:MipA/OmpV family protein [Sphingomicrobium sp.]
MRRTRAVIMHRFGCLALFATIAAPALAQSSAAPMASGLPSAEDIAKRDTFTVGVGGALLPDYEGSDDYRVIPAGAIRAKVSGIAISTNGSYLTANVIPQSGKFGFDVGPIIGLRFDSRRHSDDQVVRLMLKRKTAFEAGGFIGVSMHGLVDPYDTLSLHLDVLHDVGNAHKSTVFDPHVDFSTPVSPRTYVSVSAGAEIVSDKFARYYFGVSPGDVIATAGALPLYSPRGGLKNLKASLLVNQSITGNLLGGFSVFGLGQYSRLVGDFERSPVVEQRGNANQWLAAAGVAYTW